MDLSGILSELYITVTSEKLEETLLNKFIVLILPKICAVRIFCIKPNQQRITSVKMKGHFPFHVHIIMVFGYQLP